MKIFLGSDHAGFALKRKLIPFLEELGHEVVDRGDFAPAPQDDDYPKFIGEVARAVSAAETARAEAASSVSPAAPVRGIVLGGSGEGEAMAANRLPHVRAAEYYGGNLNIIRLSREHNDANVLSLGARFVGEEEAKAAVKLWLATPFSGESRHVRRIGEMEEGAGERGRKEKGGKGTGGTPPDSF